MFCLLFWYFPSILLHFLVSFQRFLRFCGLFATHFAVGGVISRAYLNLKRVSLHFATMFYNFEILPFPFNWLYVALISLYFVVRDDKQTDKPDSQCPPGKVISALHFAQLFPPLFNMFTSFLDMPILFFKIDLP